MRALQRFCVLAVSRSAAVPPARLYFHGIFRCLADAHGRFQTRLSSAALTELIWWTLLKTSTLAGRALWQQPIVAKLTTDACGYGWGAELNRSVPARGFFSLEERADHINVQELSALDKALDCFPSARGPGVLRLHLDSTVNVAVINNMTTRTPAPKTVLDRIVYKLACRGLRAEVTWLSSLANARADKLFRDKDSSDWRLHADVFAVLARAWGPFDVDRFATAENRLLHRFNSLVLSPGCEAVNAWAQAWGGQLNCVNPHFSQLDLVLSKLRWDCAAALVIAPEWPAFPWWRQLVVASRAAVCLPRLARLFTHGRWASRGKQPSWRTAALVIDCSAPALTASHGGTVPRPTPWPPSVQRVPVPRRHGQF